jgi:glutathione S-transferase
MSTSSLRAPSVSIRSLRRVACLGLALQPARLAAAPPDSDGDGVVDDLDNCLDVANPDQAGVSDGRGPNSNAAGVPLRQYRSSDWSRASGNEIPILPSLPWWNMSKPHLVSFDLCPYVQRSAITLQEKGVEYDLQYIDLASKPDWFLAMNPLGKVPVLQVGETVLFESSVINEYLDEVYVPQLHPADPLKKAEHRSWIEVTGQLAGPGYTLMVTRTEEPTRAAAAKARTTLQMLEAKIAAPFFSGEAWSLVDGAAAPFLQRLWWSEEIQPDLAMFDGLPRVIAWTKALLARPSVRASTTPDIHDRFLRYLQGSRGESSEVESSWLGSSV